MGARNPSQHRPGGKAYASGVLHVVKAAHHFAGSVQAGKRLVLAVQDLPLSVDLHPGESASDAAGDRIGDEGPGIDGIGPVRFGNRQVSGAAAILDGGVEGNSGIDRRIELFNGFQEAALIDAFQLAGELFD